MMGPRLRAILAQRCPVCLQGKMFRGPFAMNEVCPVCGHRVAASVAVVVVIHLANIPVVFRYSRVIWAHVNVRTQT